jgi:hypothetical protein
MNQFCGSVYPKYPFFPFLSPIVFSHVSFVYQSHLWLPISSFCDISRSIYPGLSRILCSFSDSRLFSQYFYRVVLPHIRTSHRFGCTVAYVTYAVRTLSHPQPSMKSTIYPSCRCMLMCLISSLFSVTRARVTPVALQPCLYMYLECLCSLFCNLFHIVNAAPAVLPRLSIPSMPPC